MNVEGYHYLMSPTEPLKKDKPKKLLIIIAGLIFGLFAGIAFVFVHEQSKKQAAKE